MDVADPYRRWTDFWDGNKGAFFFSVVADKMNIWAISCSNRYIFCVLADWI
jgi:hypothetical protein